jgi:hypothetical protein
VDAQTTFTLEITVGIRNLSRKTASNRQRGKYQNLIRGSLERRLERHEQNWQRAKGFLAAASVLFAVIEVAFEVWHRH